jgi:hypothetical protein
MSDSEIFAIDTPMGVCVKIPYHGYEISIAFDEKYGETYSRTDVRVYKDQENISDEVFGCFTEAMPVVFTLDSLRAAICYIDNQAN